MGKIKGWKKISENAWMNENTKKVIKTVPIKEVKYDVVFAGKSLALPYHHKTKEKALKYIKSVMRSHPNG